MKFFFNVCLCAGDMGYPYSKMYNAFQSLTAKNHSLSIHCVRHIIDIGLKKPIKLQEVRRIIDIFHLCTN